MLRSLVPPLPPRLHACPCRAVSAAARLFSSQTCCARPALSNPAVQRVWDYVNDTYVHRLIQSKTDGKLVEVRGIGCASCLVCSMAGLFTAGTGAISLHRSAGAPKQEGERAGAALPPCRLAAGALAGAAQPAWVQRAAAQPRAAGVRSAPPLCGHKCGFLGCPLCNG